MITFDEVGEWLDDIVDELPPDLYRELNGGISLSPEEKIHPESLAPEDLYILGEYHCDLRGLGRYILIYYGSLARLYANRTPAKIKDELRRIVCHELTHHLESLAGEKDLEITDARDLARYKQRVSYAQTKASSQNHSKPSPVGQPPTERKVHFFSLLGIKRTGN